MIVEELRIRVGDNSVTAIKTGPDTPAANGVFVYAPGAGSNINDPFGQHLSQRLPSAGIRLVRFQFPYMEAGKRRPDAPRLLEETWRNVLEQVWPDTGFLVVGGRSMGGRIVSQVVAQGAGVDGIVLFAYPLRLPTNRSKTRDEHLPGIEVPALFCSGTRDTFATPDELTAAASLVPQSNVHLLEGADHGFKVLKRSGRTQAEVWDEAVDGMIHWLSKIAPISN